MRCRIVFIQGALTSLPPFWSEKIEVQRRASPFMFVHLSSGTTSSWSGSRRSILRNEPGTRVLQGNLFPPGWKSLWKKDSRIGVPQWARRDSVLTGSSVAICLCQGTEGPMCVSMHKDRPYAAAPHRRHPSCWTREALAQLFEKELPRLCMTLRSSSGRTRAGRHRRGISRSDQDPNKGCDHHSARWTSLQGRDFRSGHLRQGP